MTLLLDERVRDIGIPLEPSQSQMLKTDGLQQRQRFTGPYRIVQLIESQNGSLRHPGYKSLNSYLCRLVQVTIQEQETDDYVWMVREKVGDRLRHVSADQLHLGNMTQETVTIVLLDQLGQFIVG